MRIFQFHSFFATIGRRNVRSKRFSIVILIVISFRNAIIDTRRKFVGPVNLRASLVRNVTDNAAHGNEANYFVPGAYSEILLANILIINVHYSSVMLAGPPLSRRDYVTAFSCLY